MSYSVVFVYVHMCCTESKCIPSTEKVFDKTQNILSSCCWVYSLPNSFSILQSHKEKNGHAWVEYLARHATSFSSCTPYTYFSRSGPGPFSMSVRDLFVSLFTSAFKQINLHSICLHTLPRQNCPLKQDKNITLGVCKTDVFCLVHTYQVSYQTEPLIFTHKAIFTHIPLRACMHA